MKKIVSAILLMVMALSLCACVNASCEDSHTWGEWETVVSATDYTPAVVERACEKCGTKETKEDFHQMFGHYAKLLQWVPFFTNAEYLQQNLDSVISAAFFANVPTVTTEVDYVYYHTMKISDLDAFTQKVFGYTYDYTGVVDLWVMYESIANYDANADAIVIQAMGGGDQSSELSGVTYEMTEGGSYMVTATFELNGVTFEKAFCVVKKAENYVISTY